MVKLLLGSLALVFAASSAAIAADTGFYLGASAGRSDIRDVCGEFEGAGLAQSCDDDAAGWKAFAGYNFTPNIGVEWAYVDLGKVEVVSPGAAGTATSETWAMPIVGVYSIPIGERFDLFGKAGAYFFKSETKTTGNLVGATPAVDDDGIEAVIGFGASYKFWQNLSVRVEWEHYNDAGPGDVDTLLAGLQLRF
jgi:OmpA-OmpF porin, OOP family